MVIRDRLCKPASGNASAERNTHGLPAGFPKGTNRTCLGLLFLHLAESRGLEPAGQLRQFAEGPGRPGDVHTLLARAAHRYRSSLLAPSEDDGCRGFLTWLSSPQAAGLSVTALGQFYEQMLGRTASRKAAGVYYTPEAIVRVIVRATLGRQLARETTDVTVLDPACGSGAFLLAAFDGLARWYRTRTALAPEAIRERILSEHLHGADLDPLAVEVARLSLLLKAAEIGAPAVPRLADNIRCGDALLGIDWEAAFPTLMRRGGFSIVLGNPPWGQKEIDADPCRKRSLARCFPSSAGIHDLFRPFVELGVRLTAPGGRFGMVLPDIILLKDYPLTRRYLLDQLALERIDWWGRAFASAMIDTVSIVGRKTPAPTGHRVAVLIHDRTPQSHAIPQADFRANPRHVFNLHLTPARRRVLDRLADCPRLGDYFEIHEGVHSGNMRAELFVSEMVDASCRPLLFGRDEIAPYRLCWKGRYLRRAALPARKTRERYANLGRPEWHERRKLLVRRTGDFLLAAVDDQGRYASNNFFLVFPSWPCPLDLDGLCALLNSRWMTWYFRAIEPRQGRAFAELKVKHLRVLPLPRQIREPDTCRELNGLGVRRRDDESVDETVEARVRHFYGIEATEELDAL